MEKEYLTIKEAIAYTGASESSIRRWVRLVRNQYQIELDHTNGQLEQLTPILRKRNELERDGTPRRDKHGLPVFDWLLQKTQLDEVFPNEGGQSIGTPPGGPIQQTDDNGRDNSSDQGQTEHDSGQEAKEQDHPAEGQQATDDSLDSGQSEYLWINREVFQNLLAQLDTKDKQIDRKDGQLDQVIERQRETNVLLQSYQKAFGLLPEPKENQEEGQATN